MRAGRCARCLAAPQPCRWWCWQGDDLSGGSGGGDRRLICPRCQCENGGLRAGVIGACLSIGAGPDCQCAYAQCAPCAGDDARQRATARWRRASGDVVAAGGVVRGAGVIVVVVADPVRCVPVRRPGGRGGRFDGRGEVGRCGGDANKCYVACCDWRPRLRVACACSDAGGRVVIRIGAVVGVCTRCDGRCATRDKRRGWLAAA